MFTVPVPDPVSSFAYVRQRVGTKSNNVNENLCRIVNRPLKVFIWDNGLVWAQVKVPVESFPVLMLV